ncbi:hydrolase Nlp/P60 [Taibaiella sp. KBW10]|uniref:C40 family peptidase n=1 Tax=Taibaiella sp. KBW10 TaxID=2153357 RepID=UPI000F59FA40|nr:C40 family peptidase [Taibaiella sp. KBW10]RQO30564.1 hydrolase Nlp/P60 [Taibaiella sp. KBW10]
MIFSYVVCSVPAAPIRSEATHHSQMVSQLLFGERAEVMRQEGNWMYIVCAWDHYEGWVLAGQVQLLSFKEYRKPNKYLNTTTQDRLISPQGAVLLSPGSDLFGLKRSVFPWLDALSKFKGKKAAVSSLTTSDEAIRHAAMCFYGSPYQWGGRSSLGIDCSGLAQMVYKMINIAIPRDARQQSEAGETVGFLQEALCGDLAFFDDAEGQITHVGILLDNATIMHATEVSGGVVIDAIDNGGIISVKYKKRTHNLRIVKRFL